jgi:hypothetical protein
MLLPLCLVAGSITLQQGPSVLRVGHWIEVRGALDESGRFVAERVELKKPDSDELLIGTVPEGEDDPARFTLLGQPIETDPQTAWEKLERGSLAGKRIEIEGGWKGPRKFVAEKIKPRGEGRDRIGGRIDELVPVADGFEARIMIFTVFLGQAVEVEIEEGLDLTAIPLAPERQTGQRSEQPEIIRDQDDQFGKGIEFATDLRLSGQLELVSNFEDNFDLDEADEEDRQDHELTARARLTWTPGDQLWLLSEGRYLQSYRRDEDDGVNDSESDARATLGETWVLWRDALGKTGFDVWLGRQDFDDQREWIYDENLDALRLMWLRPDWRLELAAATKLTNASERDEESFNWIAYLSNNDSDRHLALWTLYRDTDAFDAPGGPIPEEEAWHVGARVIGGWLPQNEVWAEFDYLTGERGSTDVAAWGYDVGTTWSPPSVAPLYFTLGYALGTGEADPGSTDGTYRQTGYQDNSARFGGVTTFEYYGELFEPELSNLGIFTVGIGARIAERTSLDLVYHDYLQDEAKPEFSPQPGVEADLDLKPNGIDADIGRELDLVFGFRRYRSWDIEIVGAWFDPGDAFPGADEAYLGKIQLRYRF